MVSWQAEAMFSSSLCGSRGVVEGGDRELTVSHRRYDDCLWFKAAVRDKYYYILASFN